MSTVLHHIPSGSKKLSAEERIRYVQKLWDFIVETPDQIPVPKSHMQVLDKRLAAYEVDKDKAASWSEVRNRIINNPAIN